MRTSEARLIAFGGMMAALAVVIMCLGGLIPVATVTVPVICMMILAYVLKFCGKIQNPDILQWWTNGTKYGILYSMILCSIFSFFKHINLDI